MKHSQSPRDPGLEEEEVDEKRAEETRDGCPSASAQGSEQKRDSPAPGSVGGKQDFP